MDVSVSHLFPFQKQSDLLQLLALHLGAQRARGLRTGSPGFSPGPSSNFHCDLGEDVSTLGLSFLPYLEKKEGFEAMTG